MVRRRAEAPTRWRRDEKGGVTSDITNTKNPPSAAICGTHGWRQASIRTERSLHRARKRKRTSGLLIPFDVCRDEGSLGVHMRFVLAGIRVEEAHERAIRDERHDALCLVFEGLQTADPEKDDDETDAGHYNTGAVGPCRDFEDARDHAGHGFESGLSLGDSLVHSQV